MPSTKKSSVIKFFKDVVMKLIELKPDSVHLDTSTIIINCLARIFLIYIFKRFYS